MQKHANYFPPPFGMPSYMQSAFWVRRACRSCWQPRRHPQLTPVTVTASILMARHKQTLRGSRCLSLSLGRRNLWNLPVGSHPPSLHIEGKFMDTAWNIALCFSAKKELAFMWSTQWEGTLRWNITLGIEIHKTMGYYSPLALWYYWVSAAPLATQRKKQITPANDIDLHSCHFVWKPLLNP